MFDLIARKNSKECSVFDIMDNFFNGMDIQSYPQGFRADISETDKEFVVEAELPGFDKKDITVDLKDDYLTLSAKKENEKETKGRNYLRKERNYGEFVRSFYVEGIRNEGISAKYENGILTVTLPKAEKIEPAKTTIQVQ
jgi:HSP20 family protein